MICCQICKQEIAEEDNVVHSSCFNLLDMLDRLNIAEWHVKELLSKLDEIRGAQTKATGYTKKIFGE